MDLMRLGNTVLNGRLDGPLLSAGNRLLYIDPVRKPLFRALDHKFPAHPDRADTL